MDSRQPFSRRRFLAGSASAAAVPVNARAAPRQPAVTQTGPHDVGLPHWGPYSKRYWGVSHIPQRADGVRFDLAFLPGFFRRTATVPSVLWESGYHPWQAAPDLSYYAVRYELEWKDRVYADLSFSALDEDSRLMACDLVNNTSVHQNLSLHWVACVQFPLSGCSARVPGRGVWTHALDYRELCYANARPTDHLAPDGLLRGEVRDGAFVAASAVGRGFGDDAGDTALYRVRLPEAIRGASLALRYRNSGPSAGRLTVEGAARAVLELAPSGATATAHAVLGDLEAGEHTVRLTAAAAQPFEFDGFAILETGRIGDLAFPSISRSPVPERTAGPHPASLLLKYPDINVHYGIAWDFEPFQVREFFCDDLETTFRYYTHNHVRAVLRGKGDGHFTDVFLRPVGLPPNSSRTLFGVVCAGMRESVSRALDSFRDRRDLAGVREAARARRAHPAATSAGQPYAFSQERMAATTLTNVVYPIYARRSHVVHNTPGRWWDSFYTWDSGFIGLGLLELDVQRAVDCLNAYVTPPGDEHAAFLHHGTPLPVQIYLFLEIWNRTQSRALLEHFYPRLRQMHNFLAGRAGGSTTRRLKSNLLATWDYFYNTGWDDYPPQQYMHANKLARRTAPPVTTAHAIRTARILRMAALALSRRDDASEYESDARLWTDALDRHSWDEESGYFGYVLHDDGGQPTGILRHPGGQNFNMGLCGVSPLIAGSCTSGQSARIREHLFSERRLWTRIGLSTVDQSAAYYRRDGYWNGAVWMPHQWFVWKALLDHGLTKEAYRIARTALDLWKAEVEESYNCFEHFLVESGRGAGWHHFGGLSTPVMCWHGAYHRPGRLTTGLDAWVEELHFETGNRAVEASLTVYKSGSGSPSVLAAMAPGPRYRVRWDGLAIPAPETLPGLLDIALPAPAEGKHSLEVIS